MGNSEMHTLAAIRDCRDRIVDLCAPLDAARWHTATSLPGWDVQDVVAHLGSLDAFLLGRREPESVGAGPWPYVHNALGELNERLGERRREWPPAAVLDEFRETTELRLEHLAALDEDELDAEVPAPSGGVVPQRRFIGIRLWDFVVHELDIADALGADVRVDSPGATRVLDELPFLLPRAVGKSGAPDGTTLRIDLDAPERSVGARMENGRAALADITAEEAALHLRASPAAFLRVAMGRQAPRVAIDSGNVLVRGDAHLAGNVLERLNVIP